MLKRQDRYRFLVEEEGSDIRTNLASGGGNRSRGVFFFRQKTAYEMLRSLVGSEMCIRDSISADLAAEIYRKRLVESSDKPDSGKKRNPAFYPFHQYQQYHKPFRKRRGDIMGQCLLEPVSYTHLTLPTIYSV